MLVVEEMLDALPGAGKKVVGAEDVAACREKPLAKMRAQKPGPAGHQNSLLNMHETPIVTRVLSQHPIDMNDAFRGRAEDLNLIFFAPVPSTSVRWIGYRQTE